MKAKKRVTVLVFSVIVTFIGRLGTVTIKSKKKKSPTTKKFNIERISLFLIHFLFSFI